MNRKPLLFLFLITHFFITLYASDEYSNEDLLAELNGAPSGIINGSVHVITGRYCDTTVDLRMSGASGLTFERSRLGRFFAGWNTNHQGSLVINTKSSKKIKKKEKYQVIYSGAHGQSHIFSYKAKNLSKLPKRMEFTNEMAEKGVTNISSGYISGQTNIKNDHINYDYHRNRAKFVNSHGEIHYFYSTYTSRTNLLDKIVFPNTVQWHYSYTDHDDLRKIKAINGHHEPCGWITFDRAYEPKEHKHAPKATVRSSDGQVVHYKIKDVAGKKGHYCPSIVKVEGSHIPTTRYEYTNSMLTKRKYANGRFLGTQYYRPGTYYSGNRTIKVSKKTNFKNRVAFQTAPVGHDTTPIVTHRYFYDIKDREAGNGKTEVLDAYNRLTTYDYSNSRLDAITYYSEDNTPQKIDRFFWGSGGNTGNIVCRTLEDGSGTPQICRTYEYDHKGNVLEDRIYGNLSGTCTTPIEVDSQGNVKENGVESFSKKYTYITNRYNLVETEWDGKKLISYEYRPNSNLMTKKLISVEGAIVHRRFNDYNRFGCVTREVSDDGNGSDENDLAGVTERQIVEYDYDNSPVVGLPSRVVKKVWNPHTGIEEFMGANEFSYTQEGWVTEERRIDSEGNCAGTTSYAHDRFGNVIHKIDPMGFEYSWKYDDHGNMTFEQGPRLDVHKEFRYDFSNRLIAEEEVHSDGLRLKRSFSYDYLGNPSEEVDIYGNITHHSYDRFNRKILSVGPDGNAIESATYNSLNQAIVKSDAMGHPSHYSYNIRGAPVEVIHPDGTSEKCIYNLDGTVKEKIERDGKRTVYTYDQFDRELTADLYDTEGNHIYQVRKEYNTVHLLREIDPEGYVTEYSYDHCGRVIRKAKGCKVQEYEYDASGRRSKIIERASANDGVVTEYEYDALDRVIETTIKNLSGEVQSWESCSYDHDGNKIRQAKEVNGRLAITSFEYDARGKVIKVTDPAGRESHTLYRYDHRNEEGLCVPYREEISPSGNKKICVGDIYGKDKKVTLVDPLGKTRHITYLEYDRLGNKLEQVEEVYARGEHLRDYISKWEYDECSRPVLQVEGYGTPIQKETRVTYDQHGKKSSVTKPDGITVTYQYGDLGLLENVFSSDGSIHYEYTYDVKGNPLVVTDHVNEACTKRLYDQHGKVVHERQATGISISTEYDALGRVKAIHHPDAVRVFYDYQDTCKVKFHLSI